MNRITYLFYLLASTALAQKPSNALDQHRLAPGQPVAMDAVSGQLTAQDFVSKNAQGQARFTDAYAVTLAKGEELVLEYASPAYRVMLGFKTPEGYRYDFDSLAFEGLSAKTFRYVAPAAGTYPVLVTSADPQQGGAYLLRKFIFSPQTKTLPAGADFCARLRYLVAQRRLDFSRIRGEKLREDRSVGEVTYYRAAVEAVPGRPAEIFTELDQAVNLESISYKSVLLETNDTTAARRVFDEYAAALKTCLPDWEQESEEQEDFFREVSAATYTDFLSISMRKLSEKAWRVEFNYN
jgi:hypothetical protein